MLVAYYGHALHPLLLQALCCCFSCHWPLLTLVFLAAAPGVHILLLLPKLRACALELPPSSPLGPHP
jgi:hypothetical protein